MKKNYNTRVITASNRSPYPTGYAHILIKYSMMEQKVISNSLYLGKAAKENIDTILRMFGYLINEILSLYQQLFRSEGLNSMSPELRQYREIFLKEMEEIKKIAIARGIDKEHIIDKSEQIAEFIRVFSTNRELAQKLAPQTTKSFIKVISQDQKLSDFYNQA